jgi:hypothetical protein
MKTILLSLLLFFSYSLIAGGPWLNKSKSGFFQIQSTFPSSSYNKLFLRNSNESTLSRSVLDYTLQAYLEYGLTDKLNIISTLPYKFVGTTTSNNDSAELEKGSLNGLGNYKIGLKYGVLNKGLKVAISIQSNLNTITKDLNKGLATGYDANSLGLYIHIGKGFTKNLYSFIDGGVNAVGNDYSNYIDIHYELGYQIKPSLWTALTFDIRESFKNGSNLNENLKQTGLYTNNQEYFAYGLKASYELKSKIGFTAATFGAFSGNYVAKIATFSLGVYKKW